MTAPESDSVETLILDLIEWVGRGPRDFDEALEAWRTSCPRLPVWEEASRRGLLVRRHHDGRAVVCVTRRGASFLAERRPKVRIAVW
jgi:D-3-phosphoglycerate dehydrogenase